LVLTQPEIVMKRTFCTLILTIFIGLGTLMAQSQSNTVIQFQTLGNCAICKIRIEAKLARTEGVVAADWDYNNDVTTIEYDESVTDAFQIMHAIADTGHDTEWYAAPDSMYALLIGSCCEYERTINYSNVQIGYLSLMGLWVFPVGVDESLDVGETRIYPTIGAGMMTVDLGNSLFAGDAILTVYSMDGRQAYRCTFSGKSRARVDLTSLSKGQYLAVISSGSEILSTSRLILTN